MKALLQRWQAMVPREQWLTLGVGFALLGMLYVLLVADPLALRQKQLNGQLQGAKARLLEAQTQRAELQRKREQDPNLGMRSSLLLAQAEHERLLDGIDHETAALFDPPTMRRVLEDLLRAQPGLNLMAVESFSAPLEVPGEAEPAKDEKAVAPAVSLYRHGVRLTLEGGYFELIAYLQAVQATGWRLHWQQLDYQVDAGGSGRASIRLELYTLSRQAGWVGV